MASKRKTPPRPVVVFGDALDLHVLAVEEALASMDVPVVLLPPDGLRAGVPWQAEVLPGGLEVSGLWPPGVDRPRSVWAWRLPPWAGFDPLRTVRPARRSHRARRRHGPAGLRPTA